MRIEDFVKNNRDFIDQIAGETDHDDDERELWVLNNETLYNAALAAGVEDG